MKKIIAVLLSLFASIAFGQTFPVQNLTVNGTSSFAGASNFVTSPTVPTPATGSNNTQVATMHALAAHAPCQSIIDYGGNNAGTGDNLAAFNAAVAAQPAGQVCVYFPAGVYAFANPMVYTFPNANPSSVTIIGAGSDLTVLKFSKASAPGIAISFVSAFNAAHIRDMTVAAAVTPSANTAIFLNQTVAIPNPANSALSDITNVTFRGLDGYVLTDGWSLGVEDSGVSNVNFTNDLWVGPSAGTTGVLLTGNSTDLATALNFVGCYFDYINIGINYASWVQGVTVTESNFTGGVNGIVTPAGQLGLDELIVTNSQFNVSNTAILLETEIEATMISNNLFIVNNNGAAINMANPGIFSITGNDIGSLNIGGPSTNGIIITGNTNNWPGVITGNIFSYFTNQGIFLDSGTKNVNIQSNVYFGNTKNITNSGTGNTLGGGSQ